jgi:hypothetical protein
MVTHAFMSRLCASRLVSVCKPQQLHDKNVPPVFNYARDPKDGKYINLAFLSAANAFASLSAFAPSVRTVPNSWLFSVFLINQPVINSFHILRADCLPAFDTEPPAGPRRSIPTV